MATYISRTPGSAGNRKKFTISMWVKRVVLGVDQWLVQAGASGSEFDIRFNTSDQLRFSTWDGSNGYGMITTRRFRDTSAWYHLVFQYDTAQATDTNRNKIYVNGVQISPSDTSAYNAGKHPPQNYDNPSWNNTAEFRINDVTWTSSSAKDAVYTHIHHTDGYAYDASTFGSTDSTTGEWNINTSPSVTYGTNGFFILKDSASTTDQSGNSLTFSTSGTLTNTEDNPSNNFAVLNAVVNNNSSSTLTNGNTTHTTTANWLGEMTTIGAYTGKYYAEGKLTDRMNFSFGICQANGDTQKNMSTANNSLIGNYSDGWGFNGNNGDAYNKRHNGTQSTYGSAFADNDIFMIAMDLDNGAVYFGKNGTWFDSGNPATNTNPAYSSITFTDSVHFCSGMENGQVQWNFGNGYFGTTAISSEGTNASGIGKFEYDVPTGYTALSTKGLNE